MTKNILEITDSEELSAQELLQTVKEISKTVKSSLSNKDFTTEDVMPILDESLILLTAIRDKLLEKSVYSVDTLYWFAGLGYCIEGLADFYIGEPAEVEKK